MYSVLGELMTRYSARKGGKERGEGKERKGKEGGGAWDILFCLQYDTP
jgi:hypothetical protein